MTDVGVVQVGAGDEAARWIPYLSMVGDVGVLDGLEVDDVDDVWSWMVGGSEGAMSSFVGASEAVTMSLEGAGARNA